jgi:RimJ/RimL family protein N-acetyltransferase
MNANGHKQEAMPPADGIVAVNNLREVSAALGDTPETVIVQQFLRDGAVEVLCAGAPADLEGILIQVNEFPEEPIAFGKSADAVASLLPHLNGWTCVNVPAGLVDDLIAPVAEAADAESVRLLDDVHHVLRQPVPPGLGGAARLLDSADEHLVRNAPDVLLGAGVARVLDRIETGHVAGVIEDGELVSLALTFAVSALHADIGVATHPDWRGKGYGTNVAARVATAVLSDGRTPVWSCGGTNLASMGIARRLGFEEVFRRVYLIPEWDEVESP